MEDGDTPFRLLLDGLEDEVEVVEEEFVEGVFLRLTAIPTATATMRMTRKIVRAIPRSISFLVLLTALYNSHKRRLFCLNLSSSSSFGVFLLYLAHRCETLLPPSSNKGPLTTRLLSRRCL